MKRVSNAMLVLVLVVLIVGCGASWKKQTLNVRSFELGAVHTVTIGQPIVARETGTLWTWTQYRQDPHTLAGGRKESGQHYDDDYIRTEFVYFGKSGNVIEVSYREFRGAIETPTIVQNIKYDLSESTTIAFQNYRIQVQSASNESITYRVVAE